MNIKWLFLFVILWAALASCVPAGSADLYGSANSNQLTANAALLLAQYQRDALTATAQAPIIRITETAAALVVQAAQAQGTTTAGAQTREASFTQTAQWWTPTPNATSTAAFALLSAQQTQVANQAIRDNLQLEREQYTNNFWAILPGISFAIVAGVLIMGVIWMARRERYKPAQVDARGNLLPMIDFVEGTITDPDRMPNYRGSMSNDVLARVLTWWIEQKLGIPPLLPEVTAKRQDEMNQRDQLLDLASRGLPESGSSKKEIKRLAGQEMAKQLSETNLQSRFKILDGTTSNLDVIDGQIIQVLDQEWKEAEKK
jgi:hypothetical protein